MKNILYCWVQEKASMRGSFQDAFITNYICSHVAATLPSGDIRKYDRIRWRDRRSAFYHLKTIPPDDGCSSYFHLHKSQVLSQASPRSCAEHIKLVRRDIYDVACL